MKLTPSGLAIVEGDTYLSAEIEHEGHLDVQSAHQLLDPLRKYIPEGGVAVDVGASLGDTAAVLSEFVGKYGRVYAFEPNPLAYECLLHNMVGYWNVVTWQRGFGAEGGWATVEVDTNNVGASRLVPADGHSVPVWTLDDYARGGELTRLDFLKIDAEGWEPLVLDGAKETITKHRPVMIIEVNDWPLGKMGFTRRDIYSRLDALEYTYADFDGPYGDVLALPKEAPHA